MNMNDFRAHAYSAKKKADEPSEKNEKKKSSENINKSTSKENTIEGLLKVGNEKFAGEKSPKEKDSVYRRVAKFLLIIGVDEAAKILPHLPENQTEQIVQELASIRNIGKDESAKILEEFQSLLHQARTTGGVDTAREILQKAYGAEKAKTLIENAVPFPEGKPFEYLADADAEHILALLADESDAVRALVLAHLEPKKSAAVINAMNSYDKSNIVLRLAKMQGVSPEVVRRVDSAMHEKSLAQSAEKATGIDGRSALAEILRKMPESTESEILSSLSVSDAELGEDLRSRLFTMDDVQNADDRFVQEKLRDMSDNDIAYLIAAKPDTFRAKIFQNVSTGRGDVILEQEQILKPMRRSDCERITSQFFSDLRRAYEDGKLRIKGRDEDEYVY